MEGEQEVCDQFYFYFSAANLEKQEDAKKHGDGKRGTHTKHTFTFY